MTERQMKAGVEGKKQKKKRFIRRLFSTQTTFLILSSVEIEMGHFNPVLALTCLLFVTSCLTFVLSDHAEPTDREIIEYLWSLIQKGGEKPDFDAMLENLKPEEKVELKELWVEATHHTEQ